MIVVMLPNARHEGIQVIAEKNEPSIHKKVVVSGILCVEGCCTLSGEPLGTNDFRLLVQQSLTDQNSAGRGTLSPFDWDLGFLISMLLCDSNLEHGQHH